MVRVAVSRIGRNQPVGRFRPLSLRVSGPALMRRAWLLCLVAASRAASQTTTLVDCTVLDPRSGNLQAHQNIVIRRDRIAVVTPTTKRIPVGSRQVPCAGKFAIPGLWDMHVHVGEIEEDWFPLYVANGVTGLREMAASEANARAQRQYQADLARGGRNGPEFVLNTVCLRRTGNRKRSAGACGSGPTGSIGIEVHQGL